MNKFYSALKNLDIIMTNNIQKHFYDVTRELDNNIKITINITNMFQNTTLNLRLVDNTNNSKYSQYKLFLIIRNINKSINQIKKFNKMEIKLIKKSPYKEKIINFLNEIILENI